MLQCTEEKTKGRWKKTSGSKFRHEDDLPPIATTLSLNRDKIVVESDREALISKFYAGYALNIFSENCTHLWLKNYPVNAPNFVCVNDVTEHTINQLKILEHYFETIIALGMEIAPSLQQ